LFLKDEIESGEDIISKDAREVLQKLGGPMTKTMTKTCAKKAKKTLNKMVLTIIEVRPKLELNLSTIEREICMGDHEILPICLILFGLSCNKKKMLTSALRTLFKYLKVATFALEIIRF